MIPFAPLEPDRGPYSPDSTDTALNVLPIAGGWGPMPGLVSASDALPSECLGAWWYRNTAAAFGFIAATQTALWRLNGDGSWTNISRLLADQATNGVFAADTNWTKGTNVTISAGEAHFTSVANGQTLSQAQVLTAGVMYKVSFNVNNYSAGAVTPRFTGGTTVSGTSVNANGDYIQYLTAVTGNNNFSFLAVGTTTLDIDNVTIEAFDPYSGPDENELWQAERFGTKLYVTNWNDELQVFDVDTAAEFEDAPGSPPQAKYIETVGDFLFLAHLRVGADEFPLDWQHSKINDPTDWTITGTAGDSDRQSIPDGDEIQGIFSCPGGARIIQRRCKRRLTFTPSSEFTFQMTDIDASRGAIAPNAIVPIGVDDYIYINETGIYLSDAHQPIGAQRYDKTFFDAIDLDKLPYVQGIADPSQKIVWFRYQDPTGSYRMFGWHWEQDRFCESDIPAQLIVSGVTVGLLLDDADSLGLLDDVDIPVDSRLFKGGRITFGAFTTDNDLSFFAGSSLAATIETATTELSAETGSFLTGVKLKGDMTDFSMQVGTSTLMDSSLDWSSARTRSSRTGLVPFRADGKYHRVRLNGTAAMDWSHVHGCTPFFNQSGSA